jgi:hypothetical protein
VAFEPSGPLPIGSGPQHFTTDNQAKKVTNAGFVSGAASDNSGRKSDRLFQCSYRDAGSHDLAAPSVCRGRPLSRMRRELFPPKDRQMPISLSCPHCRCPLNAPDAAMGKSVRCTACRGKFLVNGGNAHQKLDHDKVEVVHDPRQSPKADSCPHCASAWAPIAIANFSPTATLTIWFLFHFGFAGFLVGIYFFPHDGSGLALAVGSYFLGVGWCYVKTVQRDNLRWFCPGCGKEVEDQ